MLKGNFESVSLREHQALHGGGRTYVADGLFAIPQSNAPAQTKPLPPETRLMQVRYASDDNASACYMLADDTRTVLHLTGTRACLFDLLCAHSKHEHADHHLATHLTTLERMEADVETNVVCRHHACVFYRYMTFSGPGNATLTAV